VVDPTENITRTIEIKFSVSTGKQSDKPVIVAVFKDTSEREIITGLETDNKFRNDILASISHELRTPLNGTINFLEAGIASEEISGISKSSLLIPALNCSYLLKWVINDILDLTLINSKEIKPNITIENVVKTVENCLELVKTKIDQKGLKLITEMPKKPTLFGTDHSRLFQIMLNLLNNAIKFSERGDVSVKITSQPDALTIVVSDEGIGMTAESEAQLRSYLKKDILQKRLNENSTGAGFGLFISNFLAKMLGAPESSEHGLHFTTKNNEGSKFWFTIEDKSKSMSPHRQQFYRQRPQFNFINIDIPQSMQHIVTSSTDYTNKTTYFSKTTGFDNCNLASENVNLSDEIVIDKHHDLRLHPTKPFKTPTFGLLPISPVPRVARGSLSCSPLSPRCHCHKILIVDDDPFNILSLEKMLKSLNYECNTAYHGKEAVQKYNERRLDPCGKSCMNYQLILMDCNMPVMNGFEATKEIRRLAKEDGKSPPTIIGCTAYVTESASSESSTCGMDLLINKPLSRSTIRELISGSLTV
jgi:CheY-like chemotaxis protein/anti-sigma regulatory factor (Ser/Thr protein kinase)